MGGYTLWDCRRRQVVATLARSGDSSCCPGFLVTFDFPVDAHGMRAWRLDTGESTTYADQPDSYRPHAIALAADGKLQLRGTEDDVQIWEADGSYRRLAPLNAAFSPVLSPDNHLLVVFARYNREGHLLLLLEWLGLDERPDDDDVLTLYDLETGAALATFPGATAARFTPDGQTLAVLRSDDTLQLWDVTPRRPWTRILGGAGAAAAVVLVIGSLAQRLRRPASFRFAGTLRAGELP